ncbi:sensor histidine kinase [Mammaliicoccus sciuri]|uniref:histidine kinase n=1 Tax=Sporosarcina newyorkensis 2681 TaxID=1027292 RepID=F9DTG9_9BACL|nr:MULTISPECIES: sensor histidine kinase [Sporosarcina]EGQ25727.1 sensor histidine kinase BceS [Sporosarcina newyorkensis 2681]MBY0224067.1 sensor histidine kinase [Sporosarcina aquimarina]
MIRYFIKERVSWILFFLFFQLLVLLMGFLDVSIPFQSVGYIVFLSCLFFFIFLIVRYYKETRFYHELKRHNQSFDLTTVPHANSPFEEIVSEMISEQNTTYKSQLNELRVSVEQEKDEILNWIHEVKTPLTTMQLMIDRITDQPLRSQIMYEWLRVHLLLDQQLHQKRIPFIQNDLYIEKTDLQILIFQEIKSLKLWCVQKGIGFDVNLEIKEVLTDAKWLGFIVRQLLTNAVKYSEASDIRIHSFVENGNKKLSIQDFGRGIDARDLPRIFDKGFTSTLNHHDHAATGMGLYLTKLVAESLHLDLQVQSKIGEGTVITLTFPQENEFVRLSM